MIKIYIPASTLIADNFPLEHTKAYIERMRSEHPVLIETTIFIHADPIDLKWYTRTHTVNLYSNNKNIDSWSIGPMKFNHAELENFINVVKDELNQDQIKVCN